MKTSIIIPNWNGKEKLKRNLPNVLQTKDVGEIIVVDDNSSDESAHFLETEYPQIKLIKRKKNGGFSSTVNIGVKAAKEDFIFLLNSDAVPDPDCVKKIWQYFDDPNIFSISFNTGGNWSWAEFKNGFFWHYMQPVKNNEQPQSHQTLWASGGSAVFRKKIWEALDGFDEIFDPFYEEDVDLGYRATKRGYVNLWVAEAKTEHYKQKGVIEENFSQSHVAKIAQRNQLLFIWKNITSLNLISQHLTGLIKILIIHPSYWLIFVSALPFLPGLLSVRVTESRRAKLSDEQILAKYHKLSV